ncbi:ABC transporter domain-containing protein [Heracleum sosnowskyi]|uniref:ABC transporter domain-containing protein n=1 Tax=Heracleum sosnowskyi TaxID=360622 RepID=A0AAD8JDU8_9APIA|nr:ABC transporter domain-containing protein [Heracleum sosnowskyi]
MAQLAGAGDIDSTRTEPSEVGRNLRSSSRHHASIFRTDSISLEKNTDDEYVEQWAEINRLPTFERLRSSLVDDYNGDILDAKGKRIIDVSTLGALERHMFIEKLIKHVEDDNLHLLHKLKERLNKVGLKFPTVEVRYTNLHVEAQCNVVHGKPLPTLWNSLQSLFVDIAKIGGLKSRKAKISIIEKGSGIIKPGRMTLLLGPPGCGKSSLLKALSGNLDKSLKCTGDICYNGYKLEGLIPQKNSAYINQYDLHIPDMTVRETLDFSARCQGIGNRAELMIEVLRREKEAGIIPDPDIDTFMKAISVEGQSLSLQTDYILKILGLDICADILVGDAMRRGISGGQKKRLTTGEMICPERKGVADFLQEVISIKDQAQYWNQSEQTHRYVSVDTLSRMFKESTFGKNLDEELSEEFMMSENHDKSLSYGKFSLSKWTLFKACFSREIILMRRNSFIYKFKIIQLFIIASVTMTVFLRTRMEVLAAHGNKYLGSLFYSLVILLVDGFPELTMTVARLPVFYKQRDLCFYPAWGYAIPAAILKIPLSIMESIVWVCLTYYVIGYSPEPERFFRQLLLIFFLHWTSISMFRFLASVFRTAGASTTAGIMSLLLVLLFGGFIIPGPLMPSWLKWGFWVSPITYGQIGLAVNEFLSPRWQKMSSTNTTIGHQALIDRGLDYNEYFFWISLGSLFGFILFFNFGFILALSFLNAPCSRAVISREKLSENNGRRIVLPFEPVSLVFRNVQYYVETPMEMIERGFNQKKLQLLHDITGAFRPGVLTALMGIDSKTKSDFVKDVLEIVELDEIKDSLVGKPDARAAAIVMRAVRNVVDTGRTIVCTIHQPSIDIFEAFDELILLKSGGRIIYSGPSGLHSSRITDYFESISGVPKIKNNYNPATWMLEVTSLSAEAELGLDFAHIYENSALHKSNEEIVKSLSIPPPGFQELYFATRFAQNGFGQFMSCLWKHHLSYWRSPSYNFHRLRHMIFSSFVFGFLFWDQGQKLDNQQNLFSIFGSMFSTTIFSGMNNASAVKPYISTERTVLYRERFAGMYAPWAYALAQVIIEVPYVFTQSLAYVSSFNTIFNLFSGFIIPQPQIPKWWLWLYYLLPSSWTLNAMLSSQYGDVEKEIMVFGEKKTVAAFVKDYFGFHHDRLPVVGVILMLYPIIFASIFAYCIGKFNFQRR